MKIVPFKTPFDDLLKIFSNRKLLHYTDLDFATSVGDINLRNWIIDSNRVSWAGYDNEIFVGFVSAHLVKKHLTASMTIVLLEEYQKKGFAKQLFQYAIYELKQRGFVRLESQICTENIDSIRLMESLEFECEGILRKNFLIDGDLKDSYMYAKFL